MRTDGHRYEGSRDTNYHEKNRKTRKDQMGETDFTVGSVPFVPISALRICFSPRLRGASIIGSQPATGFQAGALSR